MINKVFFENLDHYLEKHGLNKSSFAKKLGLRQSTVSNWYTRQSIPTDNLDLIAKTLNIEPAELFIRDIEGLIRKAIDNNTPIGHPDEYFEQLGFHLLKNDYVQPLGRVLPKTPYMIIDQLKALALTDETDKTVLIIGILLQHFTKEKGKTTLFDEEYSGKYQDDIGELELRKKQLARIACEIAGLPTPSTSTLADKLKHLSPIEIELIESSVDNLIENKKKNKSVS